MKKILLVAWILSLLSASAVFCGQTLRIERDAPEPPCYAVKGARYTAIPEKYAGYRDANGIYDVRIYEYTDALVVERKLDGNAGPGSYVALKAPFFTGKAGKYDWTSLPVKYPEGSVQDIGVKNEVFAERDKIYTVNETADGIRVVAIIPFFKQDVRGIRDEQIVVDTVTPEKMSGKTLVRRSVVPAAFRQSAGGGSNSDLVPVEAEMLTDDVIRLTYRDGCIEHWRLTLSPGDVSKNVDFYTKSIALYTGNSVGVNSRCRCNALIWTNNEGKGNRIAGISRAWSFCGDSSKEPLYAGQ